MSLELRGPAAPSQLFRQYAAKFPRAITRALNRAGTSSRAKMASLGAKDLGLPVSVGKSQMKLDRATDTRQVVRITATGKRIPLIDFKARGPRPSRGKGRGVTAKLPGGAGRYPHAFIAQMRSGHVGVFERSSSKFMRFQKSSWKKRRQAIRELRGPSFPKVFHKLTPEVLAHGEDVLRKNLLHELKFAGASLTDT